MQKFYFRDIEESPTAIDYLEVQSYEMNVYLVYLTIGSQSGMLYLCIFPYQATHLVMKISYYHVLPLYCTIHGGDMIVENF